MNDCLRARDRVRVTLRRIFRSAASLIHLRLYQQLNSLPQIEEYLNLGPQNIHWLRHIIQLRRNAPINLAVIDLRQHDERIAHQHAQVTDQLRSVV